MSKLIVYRQTFTAKGQGPFPIDMLRHDECYPKTETDSNKITATFQDHHFEIALERIVFDRDALPTAARWASFLWNVVKVEPMEVVR